MSKIKSLLNRFQTIRQNTLSIVEPLLIEDFSLQPSEEVSPPKWHLGHTTWFFENFILSKYDKRYKLFDQQLNFIFNSYYESQGDRILRNKRGTISRPTLEEVLSYRSAVDSSVVQYFDQLEDLISDEAIFFLELGINHEEQHQELLITDTKYILASNPLKPIYNVNQEEKKSAEIPLKWTIIDEGIYDIGHNANTFSFDNELSQHKKFVEGFKCGNRLINNKEFKDFMEDDAYSRPELWLSEGWEWVKKNEVNCPLYWQKKEENWWIYQMNGFKKINDLDPVCHISFYEAEAFARWKNCRLLTEFEWEVAASKLGSLTKSQCFSESKIFNVYQENLDNSFFGTAWEWTNSAYLPYPRYKQEEGALGEYNGKFMINQMVLRGGSCATSKSHFRITYRNFFHPQYRWQFTGIRLAKDID